MSVDQKLRTAAEHLATAADVLRMAANVQPSSGSDRASAGPAEGTSPLLRIGIFGETNSGKSYLANLLIGFSALPAHPVKNTSLPTLVAYAPEPFVAAYYENGDRLSFPANGSIAGTLAALYESGGRASPAANNNFPQGATTRLEVGLPSNVLRSIEIVDFPASGETWAAYDVDTAIWITVATQAWRASEQARWLELPEAIRSRGLLAVTYCDMIAGGKKDLKKLRARLETCAKPYFRDICFVDARSGDAAAAASENRPLFALPQRFAQEFSSKRRELALALAQRAARKRISRQNPEGRSAASAGETRGLTGTSAARGGNTAKAVAHPGLRPASGFAEQAVSRIGELRTPLLTRRGALIGLGAGATAALAGGAIVYAVRTPARAPAPLMSRASLTFTGHAAWVHSVAFAPDGRTLLSASGDNVVKLWDTASGKELRSFTDFPDGVRSAVFSPDGRTILCGGSGALLVLLDAATGKLLRTFSGHSEGIPSVAFSPDGRTALSGSWDKTLKLWDVATGRELRAFSGHSGEVHAVTFSPGGRTALSGGRDYTLKLWDIAAGREMRTFTGHTDWISAVVFSPGGQTALSSSTDETLKLWDVATGKELRSYPEQSREFVPLSFTPDGRTLLSGGGMSLKLRDVTTGRVLRDFTGHAGRVTSVAISPDGRTAVSGSTDKTLKLWDMTPDQYVRAAAS